MNLEPNKIDDIIYFFPRLFNEVKYQTKWAFQRVFRGYDDRWYWGLNGELDRVIPKCVRHMKENCSGCPDEYYKDDCKKWEDILEKIARAFELDRRIINSTMDTIMEIEELKKVFSNLKPTCSLKDVAPEMNWGVIEIIPADPSMPGILANVATIVADAKVSIRQAIVDDFEFTEEPRLFIVTEKQVPGILIPKIRKINGDKGLFVY